MIINPFKEKDSFEAKIEISESKVDKKLLQKIIINEYMGYIQQGKKVELYEKILEYLYERYKIDVKISAEQIANDIINRIFGYDILQKYIDDENVSDIRAVCYNQIYIKKKGVWQIVNETFENMVEFEDYIRYCVLKNNSVINYDMPIITVSDKKYNLRIEAGICPVNAISPNIVIRIHRKNLDISLETLFLRDRMLDKTSYKIIYDAVISKKNIIISGRGGSGKTTLLNAIIGKIPNNIPITANEETAELYISGKNMVEREIINSRSSNNINLNTLMKQSLVMSNEVLVVGELKGEETSDFLDAISTGHMGLATVHANSAQGTLNRLIMLFKRNPLNQQYKEEFIRNILGDGIDYIIFLKDYKVNQIAKINYKEGELSIENIYGNNN